MKKIILHCGMPKTGSSALQVQLAQSREDLCRYGYDYLPMGDFKKAAQGQITSGNGAELARAYLNPEHPASLAARREELTGTFRSRIAESENHVILSSEFFSATPRPLLAELTAALEDLGKVQLVFFAREQLNALASTYVQQVKRHLLTDYPDTYFDGWNISKSPMMDYYGYFNRLRSLVPSVEITVRPYELSKSHDKGLIGLLLEMIDAQVPGEVLPADSRINLSPSPQEIRLMLEVNKHQPRMQFSDMLVESSHTAGRSDIHAQHAIVPPDIAHRIRASFEDGNERFFEEFVGSENMYCTVEDVEFTDLRQVQFDATSVIDILSGILVRLDRRLMKLEQGS